MTASQKFFDGLVVILIGLAVVAIYALAVAIAIVREGALR